MTTFDMQSDEYKRGFEAGLKEAAQLVHIGCSWGNEHGPCDHTSLIVSIRGLSGGAGMEGVLKALEDAKIAGKLPPQREDHMVIAIKSGAGDAQLAELVGAYVHVKSRGKAEDLAKKITDKGMGAFIAKVCSGPPFIDDSPLHEQAGVIAVPRG